ncbi:MAG: DUF222 domain-containing protein [Actinomycetota bacterium]
MLDELEDVLDKVCADATTFADGDSIERLHRALARLEAATTVASGAFDAAGGWQSGRARSAAAWIAYRCNLPKAAASRRVHLGRDLRHLPVTERAWLAGDVGGAHASVLARARTKATAEAMERDEDLLVSKASGLHFPAFVRAVAYWSQRADPDGTEDRAAKQVEGRRFHLSQGFEGTWLGDLLLDPVGGAIVHTALQRIVDELFDDDWSEARARVGEGAGVDDLRRTPAQRRADALIEMAVRSGTAPAGGRRPEPLFTVLVGWETFAGPVCELANGTVVSPGTVAEWLDRAWAERVVFDTPSRVIDVGETRRLFTGALRRAVQVRDRECFEDLCDVPAEWCQVDHIEPWAAGGRTTEANGRLACGFHNRARHRGPDPPPRR